MQRKSKSELQIELGKCLASQGSGPKFSPVLEKRIVKLRQQIQDSWEGIDEPLDTLTAGDTLGDQIRLNLIKQTTG